MKNFEYKYQDFDDWFISRSTAFYNDVICYKDVDAKRQKDLFVQWLKAAFVAGGEPEE